MVPSADIPDAHTGNYRKTEPENFGSLFFLLTNIDSIFYCLGI